MRHAIMISLGVWLVAAPSACGDDATVPGWHVRDGFLRDPEGRATIMRGVNLSGSQKAAPYLDDKQPADYARLRDAWGMNAIRFVMTWAAVEPAEGQYDDAYLDAVAERIGWAAAHDLVVVLDMHEDIYGEGFGFDGAPVWSCDAARYAAFVPQTPWFLNAVDPQVEACTDDLFTKPLPRQHFIDAWHHVAARLANVPGVIGFDVLNEPNWGSYPLFQFEKDRLTPFYGDAVAAVRAEAPGWIAFLEPSASRNGGIATKLAAFPFGDVMYAPHSYDQSAESGAGFDPTHRQMIVDNVADLATEAHALDAGLWIGEYGGNAAMPGIVDYMAAQYDAAGAVSASTMYWAYDKSDGYGLLDPAGNEKPELLGAVVRPYPERIAGEPRPYAFDVTTSTFTFAYAPDRSLAAPSRISVPDRLYPAGYQVDCGGCVFHREPNELVIDQPGSGSLVVQP